MKAPWTTAREASAETYEFFKSEMEEVEDEQALNAMDKLFNAFRIGGYTLIASGIAAASVANYVEITPADDDFRTEIAAEALEQTVEAVPGFALGIVGLSFAVIGRSGRRAYAERMEQITQANNE